MSDPNERTEEHDELELDAETVSDLDATDADSVLGGKAVSQDGDGCTANCRAR